MLVTPALPGTYGVRCAKDSSSFCKKNILTGFREYARNFKNFLLEVWILPRSLWQERLRSNEVHEL